MSVAYGDHSPVVERVQTALITAGYVAIGNADSWFGPKTDAGVRYFQAANSIEVDGVVSTATASALGVDVDEHANGHGSNGHGEHGHGEHGHGEHGHAEHGHTEPATPPELSWGVDPTYRNGYLGFTVTNTGGSVAWGHVLVEVYDAGGNTLIATVQHEGDYPTGAAREHNLAVAGLHDGTEYVLKIHLGHGPGHPDNLTESINFRA
jgi:hypothetical protein